MSAALVRASLRIVIALAGVGCGRLNFGVQDSDGGVRDAPCAAHRGAIFCSSFEDVELADWDAVTGSVTHTTAVVRSGVGAIEVTAATPSDSSGVHLTFDSPLLGPAAHVRMYVRVAGASVVQEAVAVSTLQHANAATLGSYQELGVTSDDVQIFGHESSFSTPQERNEYGRAYYDSGVVGRVLYDAWTCLEWDFVFSDVGAGSVELRVNGDARASVTGLTMGPSGGFSDLFAGTAPGANQSSEVTIYLDDVVVDDAPVGCD